MRRIIFWGVSLGMFLVCLCVSRPAWSQQTTAAITGTVVDEGGAAINSATVTVTDTDRGTLYTAKTNDGGLFNFARVPIGNYQIKVEAPGFQSADANRSHTGAESDRSSGFQDARGAVTTTAQVTSEAPQLQSETTQVSTLIDSKTVTDIPLATRNYVELTLLAPGSVHPDAPRSTTATTWRTAPGRSSTETASSRTTSSWTEWTTTRRRDNLLAYHAVAGCHPGIQPHHEQCVRRVRQLHGRHRQRIHQVRHQPASTAMPGSSSATTF